MLLPLALLPLLRRHADALQFPSLDFLPSDWRGVWWERLARLLAACAMACLVAGLAGPGTSGASIERVGHGAEVLILFDRSSSMDSVMAAQGVMGTTARSGDETKNSVARRLLEQFVNRRSSDRFALVTFGTSVMPVAPFSDHNDAVLAGLEATGWGRGLPNTHMGAALLSAIDEFSRRPYSGSRIIVLVSDGGATLDPLTRQRIRDGLIRQRIGLDFIYVKNNSNSPDLADAASTADAEELALHRFFTSLTTAYHLYQAEDATALDAALSDIGRQQNLPLSYVERLKRRDLSAVLFAVAAFACGALLLREYRRLTPWS